MRSVILAGVVIWFARRFRYSRSTNSEHYDWQVWLTHPFALVILPWAI